MKHRSLVQAKLPHQRYNFNIFGFLDYHGHYHDKFQKLLCMKTKRPGCHDTISLKVMHLEKEFLLPGKVYGSTFPQVEFFLPSTTKNPVYKELKLRVCCAFDNVLPAVHGGGVVRDARWVCSLPAISAADVIFEK